MDAEIAAHLELRIDDLIAAGMEPDEARAEALRRFGDLDESRKRLREGARRRERARRNRDRLGAIAADLRFAWRQAARAPVFTSIVVATLALGIGLTSATWALVDHVLLRPLPFPDADRIVVLSSVDSIGGHFTQVSSSNWQDWRRESRSLAATAISMSRETGLRTAGGAVRVPAQIVSGAFFEVLRPRFAAGRPFSEREIDDGARGVVISERLWHAALGGDPTLATPLPGLVSDYEVVGVVAAGHGFPDGTDVWHPVAVEPPRAGTRNNINWYAIARLRPNVTIDQATTDLGTVAARIRDSDPTARYSYGVHVQTLKSDLVGRTTGYLELLIGAVAFVLLIACANVAAANVARGALRSRELAVRAAIGAGRSRLAQQLLVEHLLLAAIAGVVGVFIAWAMLRGALAAWGSELPRAASVRLDLPVLAVAAAVTLLASLLSGLVPAIAGSRASLSSVLASANRGATRSGRATAGRALVTAQIAIAVLLLCGSALLVRSLRALLSRDLGFAMNVAVVQADLTAPEFRADTAARFAYWDALRSSLEGAPGVAAVGLANWTPLGNAGTSFIEMEGADLPEGGAGFRAASDGYLEALEIPLIAGRSIQERDVLGAPLVAVINQAMAQRYWPGRNPIGARVRAVSMEAPTRGGAPWRTIVGVAGNVRHDGFDDDVSPEMYVPVRQAAYWSGSMTAVVRGNVSVERIVPELTTRARAVNPNVAVAVGTMSRRAAGLVASRRMTVSLLGLFGVVSLLLAALGTYGLLSYAVAQRTREMAVRAALGATRGQLIAMIVGGASAMIAVGVVAGAAGSVALSRVLESQLVDVGSTDPLSYGSAIAMIVVAALLAALIPAARASRADPAEALRLE
jgi:predicted permease